MALFIEQLKKEEIPGDRVKSQLYGCSKWQNLAFFLLMTRNFTYIFDKRSFTNAQNCWKIKKNPSWMKKINSNYPKSCQFHKKWSSRWAPWICTFWWKQILFLLYSWLFPRTFIFSPWAEHDVTLTSSSADLRPGKKKLRSGCAKLIREGVCKAWWRSLLSFWSTERYASGGGHFSSPPPSHRAGGELKYNTCLKWTHQRTWKWPC